MGGEHGTELVIAADGLDNAGLVDFLGDLDGLQGRIGREGRGLDNYAVAGQQRWDNLAEGEDQGEVPAYACGQR